MSVRDLQFIILGSGTSAGVPLIGCDCAVCRSTDPRDNRTRCSACLRFMDATEQQRVILIDASPDLRQQALRENLSRCDAIVFTHNHVDHTFGLDEVRRFNAVMQKPIDVYADQHTLEHLFRVYRHIFERDKNVNDSFVATLIPHVIDPDTPLELFGLRFTPLKLLHGKLPVLGFRIDVSGDDAATSQLHSERVHAGRGPSGGRDSGGRDSGGEGLPLAYCTDVSAIPPETWPKLAGVQTLVLDMLRYRHHPTHLTLDQAIHIAEHVGARQTWFTHMTHDISHAELDPKLPTGTALSYDGLKIDCLR